MYKYRIKLYPELLKTREGLCLEDSTKDVKAIVKEFNDASDKNANKKLIEEDSVIVGKDTIELVLSSDAWLQYPTKALRYLIVRLSKIDPYKGLVSDKGRLFKGEYEYVEEESDEITEEKDLTDEEVMIKLVKIFSRKTEENRVIIDQIKELLKRRR